jgi:hypothetical protein
LKCAHKLSLCDFCFNCVCAYDNAPELTELFANGIDCPDYIGSIQEADRIYDEFFDTLKELLIG